MLFSFCILIITVNSLIEISGGNMFRWLKKRKQILCGYVNKKLMRTNDYIDKITVTRGYYI